MPAPDALPDPASAPSPDLIAKERARFERSPDFELANTRKALEALGGFLNGRVENSRLVAVKAIIRERAAAKRAKAKKAAKAVTRQKYADIAAKNAPR